MAYTGIMRFIVKGRLAGVVATRSMFTGQVETSPGDTELSLAEGYFDAIWNPIKADFSTDFTTQSIEIQHWIDGEWISMSEDSFVRAGTASTGQMLANLVAVVLVGKAVGKRLLGRKFLSGLVEPAVAGNAIEPSLVAGFVTAVAAYVTMFTSTNGGHFGPGIVDKTGAFHSFSSGVLSTLLGTMRRRKPGLGI